MLRCELGERKQLSSRARRWLLASLCAGVGELWRARRALIGYNERKSGYGSNNRCRSSNISTALKTTTDVTPRCELLTSVPSGLDSGPAQVGRDEGNEQYILFVAHEQQKQPTTLSFVDAVCTATGGAILLLTPSVKSDWQGSLMSAPWLLTCILSLCVIHRVAILSILYPKVYRGQGKPRQKEVHLPPTIKMPRGGRTPVIMVPLLECLDLTPPPPPPRAHLVPSHVMLT